MLTYSIISVSGLGDPPLSTRYTKKEFEMKRGKNYTCR